MSQTALIIPKHLGAFEIGTVPLYTPGPGQLLIKIHATALNPADWKLQKYGQMVTEFPAVLGLDRAGEVVEIGDGVVDFKKGDRVVSPSGFIDNKYQGFQQYAISEAHLTSKIPPNISYDEASTLPLAFTAAIDGFYAEFPHGAGLPTPFSSTAQKVGVGKAVFIIGGASSVGQFAIQTAKLSGFSTIIVTASFKNETLLKSLGATHFLDRGLDTSALVAAAATITPDQAPALVFNTIGSPDTERLGIAVAGHWHAKLGKKGVVVSVYPLPLDDALGEATVKVAKIFAAPNVPWNAELLKEVFHDKLYGWLESGVVKPTHLKVLEGGLAAVPEALKLFENSQVSAHKLVVHPQDQAA